MSGLPQVLNASWLPSGCNWIGAGGHPLQSLHRCSFQPFHVAEVFTGTPGKYVDLKDCISGFQGVLEGKYDDIPEMAFYMVGDINEVMEKADELAKELAAQ